MKENIVVYLLLFVLLLTSCSSPAQPISTRAPTATFTVVPTLTATPTSTDTPLPPSPTPAASEWNGIPIMPEARAGDGDEESYVFTILATPQQIQDYYVRELEKLGWQLSAKETGSNSLILTFTNADSTTLTVSIITKGEEALVLFVK